MKKIVYGLLLVSGILSVSCEKDDAESFVQFDSALVKPVADFTDSRDNNTYRCVQIGNQIWMAENLRYQVSENSFKGCFTWGEKLASTASIPAPDDVFLAVGKEVLHDPQYAGWTEYNSYWSDNSLQATGIENIEGLFLYLEWGMSQDEIVEMLAYAASKYYDAFNAKLIKAKEAIPELRIKAGYDNFLAAEKENGGYVSKFGFLYSYDAALEAVPDGWRLPSDEDWMKLETTLGMNSEDAGKLQAWRGRGMATLLSEGGDSKFNAQKAGANVYVKSKEDQYINKGDSWYYWSSSKYQENDSTAVALFRMSAIHSDKVWRGTSRITTGYRSVLYSVRCVKDAN